MSNSPPLPGVPENLLVAADTPLKHLTPEALEALRTTDSVQFVLCQHSAVSDLFALIHGFRPVPVDFTHPFAFAVAPPFAMELPDQSTVDDWCLIRETYHDVGQVWRGTMAGIEWFTFRGVALRRFAEHIDVYGVQCGSILSVVSVPARECPDGFVAQPSVLEPALGPIDPGFKALTPWNKQQRVLQLQGIAEIVGDLHSAPVWRLLQRLGSIKQLESLQGSI